jgi:glycogen operon protein
LALELDDPFNAEHLHMMFNAFWGSLVFDLPQLPPGQQWQRMVDTALPSPMDFPDTSQALQPGQAQYNVQARSTVILVAAPFQA